VLVRVPHTSRWLEVPDRRIPASELTTLIELCNLPAEAARLREEARAEARQVANRLLDLARADAAAQASVDASRAAAARAKDSEQLASLACQALATLLGNQLAGLWQSEVALQIAAGLERLQAVELRVSPEELDAVSDALSEGLERAGLAPGQVSVVADPRLAVSGCAVRIGEQAWVVDLADWLEALGPALARADRARRAETAESATDSRVDQGALDGAQRGGSADAPSGERG
jgi:hypothetical protein